MTKQKTQTVQLSIFRQPEEEVTPGKRVLYHCCDHCCVETTPCPNETQHWAPCNEPDFNHPGEYCRAGNTISNILPAELDIKAPKRRLKENNND